MLLERLEISGIHLPTQCDAAGVTWAGERPDVASAEAASRPQ